MNDPVDPGRASAGADAEPSPTFTREIGRVRGERPGPTLLVVAGVHGNEPAGIVAARRVIDGLARGNEGVQGEFVALAGNLGALHLGRRFQVKDLNRQWSETRVAALREQPPEQDDAEDAEQRGLLGAIEAELGRARGEAFLVDLHTTSAAGYPFVVFGDTLRQRRFAMSFGLSVILGLEEQVDGVLSDYMTRRGCTTVAVEGGQHDDPRTIDHLEAVLWVALVSAGLAQEQGLAEATTARARLTTARGELPHVLEVVERHGVVPEDRFVMVPGFTNLAHARRGQLLAHDRDGEIRAPRDGMVILPLYQGQGSDGFFWGRAVTPLRMDLSERARKLGLDRVLRFLPGVRRDAGHPDRLVVDRRVARLYPLEVFHLFGYRRIREAGHDLTVARQSN